jgi:hypothetical protein
VSKVRLKKEMDLRPNSCPNIKNNDGICLEEQNKIHKYRPTSIVRANDRPVRLFAGIFIIFICRVI